MAELSFTNDARGTLSLARARVNKIKELTERALALIEEAASDLAMADDEFIAERRERPE